jgi:hypothetical protein
MTADQLEVIDCLIWDWRRRNPGIELVSYVRFDDFASARGKSIIADVKSGGGLLAPVGEATKAVVEMRILAERAFFYAKRLPFLLNWQVRAAVDDVLAESEARSFLEASRTMARWPQDVARARRFVRAIHPATADVPNDGGAIPRRDRRHYRVGRRAHGTDPGKSKHLEYGRSIAHGQKRSFRHSRVRCATVEKTDYRAKGGNRLAAATTGLMENVQPQRFEGMAKGGSAHAQALAAAVVDHAFWRAAALIAVFFLLLAIYRVFAARVERHAKAK